MKLNSFKMLPFARELLSFIQEGIDAGSVIIDTKGVSISSEDIQKQIAEKLTLKMKNWKPKYEGKDVLDDQTKLAGARFLSGVAYGLLKGK